MANFFQRIFGRKARANNVFAPVPELVMPTELTSDYSAIINRVLPYYRKLNEINKQRFLKRVYNFRKIKSFHFSGVEPREEIMILISAAAVQVSFGLKHYRLPFFSDIYVLSDAYLALNVKEPYIGHVSPTGIYISWKHFVQGFADYSDGFNVA